MGIAAFARAAAPVRLPAKLVAALVNGALLLGSVSVALGVCEILVRTVAPQQLVVVRPDIWQPDDSTGWRSRANLHTKANWGERTVHVYTDRDGFRVGNAGRHEADTRVLLIGDSFVAALQVEYEQSLAGLLEAGLPERLGRPVAIRNAGQNGWDPPQYFLEARSLLRRGAFDLALVFLYLGNDVVNVRPSRIRAWIPQDVRIAEFRWPHRLTWPEITAAVLRPVNDNLKRRSHLYIFVKTRLQTTLMRLGLSPDYFPEEFTRREATSSRWDLTADICRDIAALASQQGIPTLFVLLPAPFQVDSDTFQQFLRGFGIDSATVDLDQPTRLMRQRLEVRHLGVLDALPAFRAAARAGTRLFGRVDRHLSPAGHAVLDSLVEPAVTRLLEHGAAR